MSILVTVVLLIGNAFFVGAQFALITARRDQIEPLADAGSRAARITLGQMRNLSRMLAGSQLGIAACSLGLGAVAEPGFAAILEGAFDVLGIPQQLLHPIAFVLALALISFLHMVLGEMVPKNLALAGPVQAALMLGPPMAVWVRVTRPLLVAINGMANAILRVVRVEPKDEIGQTYTAGELTDLITESAEHGLLEPAEQQRLTRALALDQTTARHVAIPLANLITVEGTPTVRELEQLVAKTGYSRFPIRDGDTLIGYLHAKDILEIDPRDYDRPIPTALRRPIPAIDAGLPIARALTALQRSGAHIGRVTENPQLETETLRTVGVITMEDLLSELIGELDEPADID